MADWQFSVVLFPEVGLQTVLQFPSEAVNVDKIDSAIHVAEAVGGTDNGVSCRLEDIPFGNLNVVYAPEVFLPRPNNIGVNITQMECYGAHRPVQRKPVILHCRAGATAYRLGCSRFRPQAFSAPLHVATISCQDVYK